MSEEITREAAFLRGMNKSIETTTVSVECAINLLFTQSDLYTYSEALLVISTLYMLDLISDQLHKELNKALRVVYRNRGVDYE